MLRRVLPAFLVVSVLASGTANAITFTLDEYAKTVVRPASGFVDVAFTGTITVEPGFELISATVSSLWTAGGVLINSVFPDPTFNLAGTLFTVRVDSTDALGLYAFQSTLVDPAFVIYAECPIGGGFCNSARVNYSLNVVDAIPEPASMSLIGTALAGFFIRRRTRRPVPRGAA